jgi:hypothetical protein
VLPICFSSIKENKFFAGADSDKIKLHQLQVIVFIISVEQWKSGHLFFFLFYYLIVIRKFDHLLFSGFFLTTTIFPTPRLPAGRLVRWASGELGKGCLPRTYFMLRGRFWPFLPSLSLSLARFLSHLLRARSTFWLEINQARAAVCKGIGNSHQWPEVCIGRGFALAAALKVVCVLPIKSTCAGARLN